MPTSVSTELQLATVAAAVAEAVKIGQPTGIVVLRGEQRLELQITPGSRD